MSRDTVQLETAVNTIFHEYLLEFTSEYGISETLYPELPVPEDRIVDLPEGKVGVYTSKRPGKNTPQCYTIPLDSLKNWNNRFFWVDERVFPTVVDWRTNAPKDRMPADGTYSVEAMDELAVATDSSSVPSTIERSPLDFAHEAGASDRGTTAPEMSPPEDVPATAAPGAGQAEETATTEPFVARESCKRDHDKIDANAPQSVPADVSDPDPLDFTDASSPHPADVIWSSQGVAAIGDPGSENVSSPTEVGSPGSVYRPVWDVTNGSLLDTPEACGDGFPIASFEQEAKLLQKSVAQVARREQRIQARESEIKNMEALLETEADMKRAAEKKSAGLSQELERMRAQFSKLQVSNERLSQQVDALQQQVSEEETLKAAFEDYKWQQDQMVEQRCAEMDARLDAMSIDFDEELYPHMLTAIAGCRWVIGYGLRLVTMKCAESLEMSSSQLTILVYPEVRDPRNPWAYTEEIKLADAIAANISRVEQKKRSRIGPLEDPYDISFGSARPPLPLYQQRLNDFLKGKRYLIVIEDIKSLDLLIQLKRALPDERKGSKVVITTSNETVASFKDASSRYDFKCLDMGDGFKFFISKTWGKKGSPFSADNMKDLKIKLAESCKGTLLNITMLAGLLSTRKEYSRGHSGGLSRRACEELVKRNMVEITKMRSDESPKNAN
nr:putative NB-ARC [Tanacetum cinerariifolium]